MKDITPFICLKHGFNMDLAEFTAYVLSDEPTRIQLCPKCEIDAQSEIPLPPTRWGEGAEL